MVSTAAVTPAGTVAGSMEIVRVAGVVPRAGLTRTNGMSAPAVNVTGWLDAVSAMVCAGVSVPGLTANVRADELEVMKFTLVSADTFAMKISNSPFPRRKFPWVEAN